MTNDHHDLSLEDYLQRVRDRLLICLDNFLGRRLSIIEASRLRWRLGNELNDDDPLFRTFLGIDSETDHLPVGDERNLWNPKALIQKNKEIREMEINFESEARIVAEVLRSRLGH